jgi:hypothetical protein
MTLLLFEEINEDLWRLAKRLRQALGWNDHLGLPRSAEQSANAALRLEFTNRGYQLIAP